MAHEKLDVDGPAAPPRTNGELVFAAPWEARVFGLAIGLCEAGCFEWEDFRARLIASIGAWDQSGRADEEYCYYSCWAAALEAVLSNNGTLAGAEITARAEALSHRPHGHDH